ncbi:MAG: metallophosphoesterase, partial [Bacteroidales bacterium]|nr:metallophosphoesterase [Bacteroidales bacterium]
MKIYLITLIILLLPFVLMLLSHGHGHLFFNRMIAFAVPYSIIAFPLIVYTVVSLAGRFIGIFSQAAAAVTENISIGLGVTVLLIMIVGHFWGPTHLKVKDVTVESNRIPAAFDGYKIVHLSDMHLASQAGHPEFVEKVVDAINEQKADMVCFTGDLVTRDRQELTGAAEGKVTDFAADDSKATDFTKILRRVRAKDGVYAVLGNHDYHAYTPLTAKEKKQWLEAFKGDIKPALLGVLSCDKGNINVLKLASAMHLTAASPELFSLASSSDADLREQGISLLPGLVTSADASRIAELLNKASDKDVKPLQTALLAALKNETPASLFKTAKDLASSSSRPALYFPAIASSGTDEAVDYLCSAYRQGDESALASLATIENIKVAPVLFEAISGGNLSLIDKYVGIVGRHETDLGKKSFELARVIKLSGDARQKARILGEIANIPTMKAFLNAGSFIDSDNEDIAYAAADALRKIAAKTEEELDYGTMTEYLGKAQTIFRATGDADDGYAADEIGKILRN